MKCVSGVKLLYFFMQKKFLRARFIALFAFQKEGKKLDIMFP